ncbi:C99L2 protein, partial [Cinclus mexicanus]|nr:C99L2 protein [Cinclus mexicanus]
PHKQGYNNPFSTADFDLADYFDTPVETTTKPAKPTPKPFPKPGKPDNSFWDVIRTTTTKQPKTTRAPPKRNPEKDPMDFDLADALDDKNDGKDAGRPAVRPGEGRLTSSLCSACYQPCCSLGSIGDPSQPDTIPTKSWDKEKQILPGPKSCPLPASTVPVPA